MKTSTDEVLGRKRIRQRIRNFYSHFNAGKWTACYRMVDPILRESLNFDAYAKSLADFRSYYGPIKIFGITKLKLHSGVKGGYGGRDFAFGVVIWLDDKGQPHIFNERWIRNENLWFTRMAGLVSPDRRLSAGEVGSSGKMPA